MDKISPRKIQRSNNTVTVGPSFVKIVNQQIALSPFFDWPPQNDRTLLTSYYYHIGLECQNNNYNPSKRNYYEQTIHWSMLVKILERQLVTMWTVSLVRYKFLVSHNFHNRQIKIYCSHNVWQLWPAMRKPTIFEFSVKVENCWLFLFITRRKFRFFSTQWYVILLCLRHANRSIIR